MNKIVFCFSLLGDCGEAKGVMDGIFKILTQVFLCSQKENGTKFEKNNTVICKTNMSFRSFLIRYL